MSQRRRPCGLPESLLLISALVLLSCNESIVSPPPEGFSRINGQVETGGGSLNGVSRLLHEEGARVAVLRVTGDASPDTVSIAAVLSDSEGRFLIETSVDNISNLIVVARGADQEYRAVVTAAALRDSTIVAPPLNRETTLEALVYERLRAQGAVHPGVFADAQPYLNSSLANVALANPSAMTALAAAIKSGAEAQETAIDVFTGEASSWESVTAARFGARVRLDSALDATSENALATDAAYKTYYAAEEAAFQAVGLTSGDHARIREISVDALTRTAESVAAEVRISLVKAAAYRRSRLIERAIRPALLDLNATPNQLQQLETISFELHSGVLSAANPGQIRSAFGTFHDRIVGLLTEVDSGRAGEISAADSSITTEGGPLRERTSRLSACSTIMCRVQAYTEFYQAIPAVVDSRVPSADPARRAAISEVLTLVTMAL